MAGVVLSCAAGRRIRGAVLAAAVVGLGGCAVLGIDFDKQPPLPAGSTSGGAGGDGGSPAGSGGTGAACMGGQGGQAESCATTEVLASCHDGHVGCEAGMRECVRDRLPCGVEDCQTAEADESCDGVKTCSFAARWAQRWSSLQDATAVRVVVDDAGHAYVAGTVRALLPTGIAECESATTSQGFVMKLAQGDGALLWAHCFDGPGDDAVYDVAVDAEGVVAVTGVVNGTVGLGGGPPEDDPPVIGEAGKQALFASTYDRCGNLRWARHVAGAAGAQLVGRRVVLDANGRVAIAAEAAGSFMFGVKAFDLPATTPFVAAYSAVGDALWLQPLSSSEAEREVGGLVAGATGDLWVAGTFRVDMTFSGDPIAYNDDNVFLAHLDDTGSLLWGVGFGDSASQRAQALAIGPDGGLIVAGKFQGDLALSDEIEVTHVGDYNGFVARFFPEGSGAAPSWARDLDSSSEVELSGAAVDGRGNVVVVGSHRQAFMLDSVAVNHQRGDSQQDGFVLKLLPNGDAHWSRSFGELQAQFVSAVATDAQGNVVFAGLAQGEVGLDGVPFTGDGSVFDVFVGKSQP